MSSIAQLTRLEPTAAPERLAFKTTATEIANEVAAIDVEQGIVLAIVSVTGTVDDVDDIIEPGAYTDTLARIRPKVCWAHSWEHPVGKVLNVIELPPGDPRLPEYTRTGAPWPREAGALLAEMQFNLRTDEGRNAFEVVRFYSDTGEAHFSIGYNVPPGKSTTDRHGVRRIRSLDLYELSVVLFGAHPETGTISIKAAARVAIERKAGAKGEGHQPPQDVRDAAQRGLDLRREHGRGGTPVGVARARDLARGANIPTATLKRMHSFFARHAGDADAAGWDDLSNPSAGRIAHELWGGDPGKRWAESVLKREEKNLAAPQSKALPDTEAPADERDECTCCGGAGEHTCGHECHVCDASGQYAEQVTYTDVDEGFPIVCQGHHGRSAAGEENPPPEGHDEDPISPDAPPDGTPLRSVDDPDEDPDEEADEEADEDPVDDGAPIADADEPDGAGAPDFSDGVMVAVYPDPTATQAVAAHISGPDGTTAPEALHVTLAYLGKVGEAPSEQDVIDAVTRAIEGSPALSGQIAGLGMFPDSGDGAPTWAPVDVPGLTLLREQVVSELGDAVSRTHGFQPHMTLGYDIGMIEPVPVVPVTFDHVRVVYGNSETRLTLDAAAPETKGLTTEERLRKPTLPGDDMAWPIGDADDLRNAISAFGRAREEDRDKVKRWIIRRARDLGQIALLPDSWDVAKAYDPARGRKEALPILEGMSAALLAEMDVYEPEEKAGGADRNRGGAAELRRYWTVGPGGAKIRWNTPGDFTRCTRLLKKYMPGREKGYCFTGDTEFLTRDGVTTFAEAVGTVRQVLTQANPTIGESQPLRSDGRWVDAPIESFGEQRVLSVTLRRGSLRKIVRATPEHEWFASANGGTYARGSARTVRTSDLRPGMVLATLLPRPPVARTPVSPFGIVAGLMFGDGSQDAVSGGYMDLWGEKDASALRYFAECRQAPVKTQGGVDGVRVRDMPNSWKRPPALDEGVSFLAGWLAGYILADGSVNKSGGVGISSASREHLEHVARVANRIGISTYPINFAMRRGFGEEDSALYKINFARGITAEMLIAPEHRRRFLEADSARETGRRRNAATPIRWAVESVEDHGEAEEVFCAVVPDTETFALADYIWVHNCALRHREMTGMWPGDRGNKSAQADGSYEARQQQVFDALRADYDEDATLDLRGTWEDQVLYGVHRDGATDYFVTHYDVDEITGVVTLGEPMAVDVSLTIEARDSDDDGDGTGDDDEWQASDALALEGDVMRVVGGMRFAQHLAQQAKSGRVLSGANERALREALRHLLAVMHGAGIDLGEVSPENPTVVRNTAAEGDVRREVDPAVDLATTSPTGATKAHPGLRRSGEVLSIDMDAHRRLLGEIADLTEDD